MKFEMWSASHYLFILSPFIVAFVLWLVLKNKSTRTKEIVGVVLGVLSLLVLVVRNVDIYLTHGFDPEIIPLQVCHLGNIFVFVSLVFKNKVAASVAFCFNLVFALSSFVVADALEGYSSIFQIRAQAYIWGHLLIVVGALYPVMLGYIKFNKKHTLIGVGVVLVLCLISIVANTIFNDLLGESINYFYIYNSKGVPFGFIYNLGSPVTIGSWFTFNPVYVAGVMAIGIVAIALFHLLSKAIYKKTYKK